VNNNVALATASRDSHLALRRVERQQVIIERLYGARGRRMEFAELASEFGVSTRTIARDVERLRLSGVPLSTHQGSGGGVSLDAHHAPTSITFDLPEIAALMSSLAVLGPTASQSAGSAIRKLAQALAAGT
jgi:predicted DNA-binding transcriptional regulator YafY